MTNTELIQAIKAEIERHLNSATEHQNANPDMPKYRWYLYEGEKELCTDLLGYIDDSLESEKPTNPEDAMKELNEKIALVKQRGTWDGVDVDKYMDEVRGREPEKPTQEGLEEEIREYMSNEDNNPFDWDWRDKRDCARHFAKWGAEHAPLPEDTVLFQKGVAEGKRLMMEDYPKWHKVQRGSCFDKHTNFLLLAREGHFYCSSMEVPRDGYILLVDELERLPKEDEK